jgi:hypothetical protein
MDPMKRGGQLTRMSQYGLGCASLHHHVTADDRVLDSGRSVTSHRLSRFDPEWCSRQ